MKRSAPIIVAAVVAAVVVASAYTTAVQSQSSATETRSRFDNKTRRERFTHSGAIQAERGAAATGAPKVTEAPTGFDNLTNGFRPQGPAFDSIDEDNVGDPTGSFNAARFIFEEAEQVADGLGPTYNAQGCRECHQNVVTGGASQIAEHRTGFLKNGEFEESLGGSIIQSRATHPNFVERVDFQDKIETFRISTNTLGNGFVECISNSTLLAIRDNQPAGQRGTAVMVPVLEANGKARIGRFGWKSQHASLESFSADAYLNEMGITTPLLPDENLSHGEDISYDSPKYGHLYDPVPDPEDDGVDVVAFATFMRSTKAPSRGPIDDVVNAGGKLFAQIGCVTCHVASITTAPPGTSINGGKFLVPDALGNKIIHPYSDFLLHDIGTSDGIPITRDQASTANKMRTAPLWALRTRNRLMHDGLSFTKQHAIGRHGGQAASARSNYNALSQAQKDQLLRFLDSL